MKHLLFAIAFLALTFNAFAQKCTIPVAIECDDNQFTTENDEERLEKYFSSYLMPKGFVRDDNSRLRFRLTPVINASSRSLANANVEISMNMVLEEVATGNVLHSAHIDTLVFTYLASWNTGGTRTSTGVVVSRGYGTVQQVREKEIAEDATQALSDYGKCFANKITQVEQFVNVAKDMIVTLYDSKIPKMVENARIYAGKGFQDRVLFYFSQVPTCCEHYSDLQECAIEVFLSYTESHPAETLKDAENVWKKDKSELSARYVIALINATTLTDKEQKKAAKLIEKIQKAFPQLNVTEKIDLTKDSSYYDLVNASIAKIAKNVSFKHKDGDDLPLLWN